MFETLSTVRGWAGFLFWLGLAALLFTGQRAGAAGLALLGLVLLAALQAARLLRGRRRPARRPPPSDLPDYDFKNVKPSDFE